MRGNTNAIKPLHHYSTTEQVIGTWIDGNKPLYEKTFIVRHPNFSNSNVLDVVDVSSMNIDFAFISNVIQDNTERDVTDNENHATMLPVGVMAWGFNMTGEKRDMIFGVNRDCIRMYCSSKVNFANLNFIITIRYTKTTDQGAVTYG